jgi:hypothetical protein
MELPSPVLSQDRVGCFQVREVAIAKPVAIGQCSQVVMISCLHLSHEAVQPPGRFAWTQPNSKEAAESTLRIMRRTSLTYTQS